MLRHEAQITVEPHAFHEKTGGCFTQGEWIVADKFLPVRRGREQFGIIERNGEKAPRRNEPSPKDCNPLVQGRANDGTEAGTEQGEAVDQSRMAALERGREFSAPRDRNQKDV